MPRSDGHALKIAKRWLYLTHRWIGIASCLLFGIWLLSGLVMIYVPYPSLSAGDRAAAGGAIDWRQVTRLPPVADARQADSVELIMRDGLPVWRLRAPDGTWSVASARAGGTMAPVDEDFARREAARFTGRAATGSALVERDQWTVAGGFDAHRPLWKVSLDDGRGTEVYISTATGGVVQRTTRRARFWNWLGSVPHWIYPTLLRQDNGIWRQVVMWVSGPCIAAAVTGFWIGLLRMRVGRRRFKGGRVTPYHGWMLWHHIAGVSGGLFLIAWIFSGWLSVDPGRLFAGTDTDPARVAAYSPPPTLTITEIARLRAAALIATSLRFMRNAGMDSVIVWGSDGRSRILASRDLRSAPLQTERIAHAAMTLVPEGHPAETALLTARDSYWYGMGNGPQLPVLRVKFDDPARSWLYLDPRTGAVLARIDDRRRIYRWLFDLLHKWDLNYLTQRRPLWDILLWSASILGLLTSASAIRLAIRRLRPRVAATR